MRIRHYLELVRLPNLVTAAADPLAGFLLAGGALSGHRTIFALMTVSACLYAAGVALNDVCDTEADRVFRPERTIPSGRIDRRRALHIVVILFVVGLLIAWRTAPIVGGVATVLIVVIVSYDVILKKTFLAPAAMGLCRALNLVLGLCASGSLPTMSLFILAGALMWLYVSSVTLFARTEAIASGRTTLIIALFGLTTAVAGQGLLHLLFGSAHLGQLIPLTALVGLVVAQGCHAIRNPSPAVVQRAAHLYLIGLLLFDALLVWIARGPYMALMVAALVVPTALLSYRFRMT